MAPDLTTQNHAEDQLQHAEIEVHGLVQGVNFRLTFKRVAYRLKLRGEIWNDQDDEYLVQATVEGMKSSIDQFVRKIEEFKIRPHYEGEMAPAFSLIEVDTIQVERQNIDDYRIESENFRIRKPELEDKERVQLEILDKISMGGVVYQQFHNDHNHNFHTLESKFGTVSNGIEHANQSIDRLGTTFGDASDGIKHANQSIDGLGDHLTHAVSDLVKWVKIGIFTLVGIGAAYIVVRVSIG